MRRIDLVAVSALALFGHTFASQDANKAFKAFVTKLDDQLAAAYAHKDSAFFEKLYAPNFVTKDEHGVTNGKKIALYLLRYHFNTLQKLSYHTKLLSLETSGKMATIKIQTVLQARTKSPGAAKGAPIKVTRIERQVFIKSGDGWQMSLDQDLTKPILLQPASTGFVGLKPAGNH